MKTAKTKSGFEFTVKDSALDNWELLEVLSDIDDGKTQKMGAAVKSPPGRRTG